MGSLAAAADTADRIAARIAAVRIVVVAAADTEAVVVIDIAVAVERCYSPIRMTRCCPFPHPGPNQAAEENSTPDQEATAKVRVWGA